MARKATKNGGIRTILDLANATQVDRSKLYRARNSGYIAVEADGTWIIERVARVMAGLSLTNRRGHATGLAGNVPRSEEEAKAFRAADLAYRRARAFREQTRADKEAGLLVSKEEVVAEVVRRDLELKDELLSIPQRIAVRASHKPPKAVAVLITGAISEALTNFCRAGGEARPAPTNLGLSEQA